MRVISTLVLASLTATLAATGVAPDARADDPLIKKGDVLVNALGPILSGDHLDRVDPGTQVETLASFEGSLTTSLVATRDGDVLAGDFDGNIERIDHLTGESTRLRAGQDEHAPWEDLALEANGSLVGLFRGSVGTSLVRVNSNGTLTKIADDGHLAHPQFLAVESDGTFLVADHKNLGGATRLPDLRQDRHGRQPEVAAAEPRSGQPEADRHQ